MKCGCHSCRYVIPVIDLCVGFRGPPTSDIIKVDLFDLSLAHVNGKSEKIILNTSEDFLFKFLDLADRIVVAASEFAGVDLEMVWNEETDAYKVLVHDHKSSSGFDVDNYTPPKSDLLCDVTKVRVSPFAVVVSFKRNPQVSQYKFDRTESMI